MLPRPDSTRSRHCRLTRRGGLIRAAKDDRMEARWLVGLALGLRQGEALGLWSDDVDPTSALLRVRRALQRQRGGEAVAEICRRLDGLPLAIELAAAWIRLLPPQALLQRLDDRMSLLTGGPRDLPERQRTLRSTLDWSFGLLSAAEQALFTRLGVFSGTFGLPAATAVCGNAVTTGSAAEPAQVMALLGRLVDSSLIRAEPHDNEPRFSLLETIREYALDRLRESGGWDDVHDQHASYFLTLAKPTEAELHGAGQLAWLNRLELRHDNVSAALSWLLQRGQPEAALDLVWATWRFWWLHGHAWELARYVDKILAQSDRLPPRERALALSGAGFIYFASGDQ